MNPSSSLEPYWGRLTSLIPHIQSIDLTLNPSVMDHTQNTKDHICSTDYQCQIYQDGDNIFMKYTGNIIVCVEGHTLKEDVVFEIGLEKELSL